MAVAKAKEGIEKELTCPLCLDIFQDPKRLPCDHIYCKDPCLQGLVLRSQNATIACPECRTVVQVPHNDVNNLPTAFQINRLEELYNKMQGSDESDSPQTPVKQKEQPTCATHMSQPIALYCETCNKTICRDCVLKSDVHKGHQYGYIEEVAEKQRKAIRSEIEPSKLLVSKLSDALGEISEVKASIATQAKNHLEQIEANFDAIFAALRQERELVKSTISQKAQQKKAEIKTQEEKLTNFLGELSDTIKQAENSIQSHSDEEIIHRKRNYTTQLQDSRHKFQTLLLAPVETVNQGLHLVSPDKMISCYNESTYQYLVVDPKKCQLKGFQSLETDKECTATLLLKTSMGKKSIDPQNIAPCCMELVCIRDNSVTHGIVSQSTMSEQHISVQPQTRGRHEISVKISSTHITGSPFPVFVHKPPQQLDKSNPSIIEIQNSTGLYCYNDKIFVAAGNKIHALSESQKTKTEIHSCRSICAFGITIENETGNWFISDAFNNRLNKIDKLGRKCIKSVENHLNFPNGLQFSKDGELFVCDTKNHRIKVYDKELKLLRTFGKEGERKGYFRFPINLVFGENGNLFVTDKRNDRVQVMTPNGETICIIGKHGSKPGELNNPIGIAISCEYLYIVEQANRRVSVFTTQGEFVTTFGNRYLIEPECIAIDRDGYVYVSDNRERIVVF